jgi:hypothetical protein
MSRHKHDKYWVTYTETASNFSRVFTTENCYGCDRMKVTKVTVRGDRKELKENVKVDTFPKLAPWEKR